MKEYFIAIGAINYMIGPLKNKKNKKEITIKSISTD